MGAFNINITGVGGHGCERKAKPGEKLYGRCGRFTCPDCAAYDFVQRLKQAGMVRDGDSAYAVEIADDDALAAEYRRQQANYEETGPHGFPTNPERAVGKTFAQSARALELPVFFAEHEKKWFRKVYHLAEFTHWPQSPTQVVDDMLKNERKLGQF